MASEPRIAGSIPGSPAGALEIADAGLALRSRIFDGPGHLASHPGLALLPVELDVAIPIRGFRVRDLLALVSRQVIETGWVQGDDLPLGARGSQLAWTEFEVIDTKLAVRISRLA